MSKEDRKMVYVILCIIGLVVAIFYVGNISYKEKNVIHQESIDRTFDDGYAAGWIEAKKFVGEARRREFTVAQLDSVINSK